MGPGEFRHVICADQWASQASAKLPGLSGRFRGGIPASGFLGPIWYISSAMMEQPLSWLDRNEEIVDSTSQIYLNLDFIVYLEIIRIKNVLNMP